MGGQAKGKKSSKSKKTHREGSRAHSLCGVPAKERMKINLQNKAKKKTEEKYSIAQLLEKVDEYMDNFNYEMAQLFCQRALDIEPTSLEILDLMGNICMEMGDAEKAKQVFLKSVELSPDKGHAKYMYLGQIHCKEEALQYFRKGLEVLIGAYQSQPHALGAASCPEKMEVTARDISTAFCSVAEIYLTDLCMEEGAGDKCKEAIQKALEYDPNSTESLQLMASYYFSMEQIQEGKEYLMKSVAQWLPSLQKKAEGSLSQNIVTTDVLETVLPPYESRITTAKLLTEAEEFELASDILEGLLEEDDEVIQVWYLLGWVCYLQGKTPDEEDAFKDSARMYLMKAKKLYNKLKCDDSQLLEHVEQLLSELGGGDGQLGDSDAEDELPENIEDDFVQSSEDDEEAMES